MNHAVWPLALIIVSNIAYHIFAKNSSKTVPPFAALVVVYLIAALCSLVAHFALERTASSGGPAGILREMNLANHLLGLSIIGLEGGFIYLYRAGWGVSVGPIISYACIAIALLVIGAFFYRENVGWAQIVGTALCIAGIIVMNR